MVRQVFIILMTLCVIAPAAPVCGFIHDCGGTPQTPAMKTSCAGGHGQTMGLDAAPVVTLTVTLSAPTSSCCPDVGPSETQHAIIISSNSPAHDRSAALVWLTLPVEKDTPQPPRTWLRRGLIPSRSFPLKLYRLYSSYRI